MKVKDLSSMLVFSAWEKAVFSRSDLPEEAFYPMLLPLRQEVYGVTLQHTSKVFPL
ncbi:MAG: hypothetical protein JW705_08080 [Methanosarcinaceae archaeon]|nr:hypothetical protein [Methanosarcinaceae archaeon]